jgi:hypothetical protein
VSAGNTTSIESAADTPLPLQAFIRDAYGNDVPDAAGVTVRVDGFEIAYEQPLVGPSYLHTMTIPASLAATLTISFSLAGVQIGEPVEIDVAPDNTVLYMGIVFGVLVFAVGMFFWLYSKFGKRGIKAGKEREVSVDVKLRKILDNKIHMQDSMTLLEVRPRLPSSQHQPVRLTPFAQLLDILSDILNSVFKLLIVLSPRLAEASAVPNWLNYLFIVLGVVAVPLGAYLITQRGRVRARAKRAQTRCCC